MLNKNFVINKKSVMVSMMFNLVIIVVIWWSLVACNATSISETKMTQEPITTEFTTSDSVSEDTSAIQIGFSESYDGNTFRQSLIASVEKAATQAKADGLIADFSMMVGEEQTGHIQDFISAGYNAIVINPGSSTELNSVIKLACEAGIVVVIYDQSITDPKCAYIINVIWTNYGAVQANYIGERLNGKGNILEVRGIKGSAADVDISASIYAGLARFPELKVVGAVHGNWTQSIAQEAVTYILPSLPDIDAVVTQGGDGYGIAAAFSATDRAAPIIIMGNRYAELKWWQEQRDANGYSTISASATPGIGVVAFWTAQQILAGKEVPKFIEMPLLVIEEDNLDAWLSTIKEGGVATGDYTLEWTVELISANFTKTPLPSIQIPGN